MTLRLINHDYSETQTLGQEYLKYLCCPHLRHFEAVVPLYVINLLCPPQEHLLSILRPHTEQLQYAPYLLTLSTNLHLQLIRLHFAISIPPSPVLQNFYSTIPSKYSAI